MASAADDYEGDKRKIAAVLPYYPFKGIDRFYDVQGLLLHPAVFQRAVDILTDRCRSFGVDKIGGFDARGFLFGVPMALALKIPFFMLRKKGKLPNSITGSSYNKEYVGDAADGGDALAISRTAVKTGERVLLIDDLVATGGTLIAGIDLVKMLGGSVVEAACIVELTALQGSQRVREKHPDVPVWSLISEDYLTTAGEVVTP